MKSAVLLLGLLLAPLSKAEETNLYPWINKSVVLNSTEHFQFYSSVYRLSSSFRDGTKTESSVTSEMHTVTFQTTEAFAFQRTGSMFRLIDDSWSPETNNLILDDVASQISNALNLPMTTSATITNYSSKMELLLSNKVAIILEITKKDRNRGYWLFTSFTSPTQDVSKGKSQPPTNSRQGR